MVSMVVNNNGKMHFRVLWKFPGLSAERGEFYAYSLEELTRILHKVEGISRERAELVCVHQINRDGKIQEIINIDKTDAPNLNPHLIVSDLTHTSPNLSSYSRYPYMPAWGGKSGDNEDDEGEWDWYGASDNDETIMAEVTKLLTPAKPHIKLMLPAPAVPTKALPQAAKAVSFKEK